MWAAMVPSPRKTRTSPRKKAWASPVKAAVSTISSIFNEADFSPLNSSWAEITANDESLNESLKENLSKSEVRRNRKAALPKKANSKPKFVRSLELTEEILVNSRRSDRIKDKVEVRTETKTRVEISTVRNYETRKRHLSAASSATINEDCDGCSPVKRAPPSSGRPARKNLKTSSPVSSPLRSRCLFPSTPKDTKSTPKEFTPKDFWEDPALGWCKDQAVLERRTKEINRAKEKPVYTRYLEEVPRHLRIKGVHPRTPNKHINFSRRSWDAQMRSWKRNLYSWAGEEPSDSVNTSFCSYSSDEQKHDEEQENLERPVSVLRVLVALPCRNKQFAFAIVLGTTSITALAQRWQPAESTLKGSVQASLGIGFSSALY
ncbi:unnamed protein product [Cylicocyclus nassatus]|uniref:Histone RNA hairpin-binding protein RNA-binding domain-containing protein n=1 Tax=Cylicocyclus nassatus TaxID=53992 RepID=A0AA36HA76_CYLNA|nr:unnamed protein product [Cylicocyclus nassatus]